MLLPTNTDYSLWRSNSSVLCLTSSVKRSDCLRKMAKHGANSSVLCPTYISRYVCKYISGLQGLVTNFQSEFLCSSHSSHPCSKCKSVSFFCAYHNAFYTFGLTVQLTAMPSVQTHLILASHAFHHFLLYCKIIIFIIIS